MSTAMESLRNLVISDFQYFKRWYDFNFNVEHYLPDKDLEKYFESQHRDVFDILSKSECARTTVRKNLLAAFGLDCEVDYDIGSAVVRMAMVGKDALERASVVSGAIFYNAEIAKVIGKRDLETLTKFIGTDTYSFIVKRKMVLWKMVPNMKIDGHGSIIEKIATAGKKMLHMALCDIPVGIRKRLEFMFGGELDISEKCNEMLAKKCFDLIDFSLNMSKRVGGN
ncbi:MAG: Yop proteins translocation protein K [Puniceicoccales bacterium]|jgi:hypothetical protein|nr:Yop proteins translocation protein K [Puniceicoccales bacterium]